MLLVVAVEASTPAGDRSPRYGSGGSLDSISENPRAERKATGYEIRQAREKYEGMKEHQLRRLCSVGCHSHQLCLLCTRVRNRLLASGIMAGRGRLEIRDGGETGGVRREGKRLGGGGDAFEKLLGR